MIMCNEEAFLILLIVQLSLCQFGAEVSSQNDFCYASISKPYLLTGTKTGYIAIQNDDTSLIKDDQCGSPTFFWFLARHGTRNPSYTAMIPMRRTLPRIRDQIGKQEYFVRSNFNTNMKLFLTSGRGELCNDDLNNIEKWTFNLTADDDSLLTDSGEEEMYGLGSRWAQRLDFIEIDPQTGIGFTDTQRTRESARNFMRGFLNLSRDDDVELPGFLKNQELLNFWSTCKRYSHVTKLKLKFTRQFTAFTLPAIKDIVKNVNRRLGYSSTILTYKSVDLMWDMCRFELSFYYKGLALSEHYPQNYQQTHSSSQQYPWCAVFTEEEMKILEDNEDLYYYYKDGYPLNITLDMTGVLLQDLIDNIETFSKNRVYFAHSETLIPFLARLGIAKDEPPLSLDNLPPTRKWRTSLIGGESANLAIVGFNCDQGKKLKFYLNEKPVKVNGCVSENDCDAEDFVNYNQHYAVDNLDEVCEVNQLDS